MRTITPAVLRIALDLERQKPIPARRSILREIVSAMIAHRIEPLIVRRDPRTD